MRPRAAIPAAASPPPGRSRPRTLLAALGLTVLVSLGGCTIPGFPTGAPSSSSGRDAAPGTGESWFWYQQGERVETASPPAAWPASNTTTRPATNAAPTASAGPKCPTRLEWLTRPLRATAGVGQGTVTWAHVLDPRVVEYKVAAVLQERPGGDDPRPEKWITVAKPTTGCQDMTATVTGLISGRHYVFWLDAVIIAHPTGQREPMIGRSSAVLVR